MDMPMKKKRTIAAQAAERGPLPELAQELLDELVKGPMTPSDVQDLMLALNKAVIERAMGAEMNLHLGYRSGQAKQPVMVHSDQGSQFTSYEYGAFLANHNLQPSMSRRGNCHDNAVAESFFQLLKRETVRNVR